MTFSPSTFSDSYLESKPCLEDSYMYIALYVQGKAYKVLSTTVFAYSKQVAIEHYGLVYKNKIFCIRSLIGKTLQLAIYISKVVDNNYC